MFPSSVIFCSSCILMLPGICCIYFFLSLSFCSFSNLLCSRVIVSVVLIFKSFYEFNAFSLNNNIKAGTLGYTNCYWPVAHEKVHDIFLALVILLSYPRWLGSNRLVAILRKGVRSIVHDGFVIIRCPKGVD